jgi:pyruvate formate lyase activating enzyme
MTTPVEFLDRLTAPAQLVEAADESGMLRCTACAHRCKIRPGKRGICQVRYNRDGELRVPWGYVAAAHPDPVEKKPFSHLLPGRRVLTFGMLGCDFHCGFCQNWLTSQTLRDPAAEGSEYVRKVSPAQLVDIALSTGCDLIASSYNEPLITSEWAVEIFKEALEAGLQCCMVSNGNATPEALAYLKPYLTAYKIDLKGMQDRHYRELGGVLQHVLDTIRTAHDLGLWVEVVTLVIPGYNDSPAELWDAARFLASVSPDIPWHVTAFHPDYKMTDRPATPAAALRQAADIGQEAGLHYVYAGNLPGRVGSLEDTHCPHCQTVLVKRRGYTVLENRLSARSTCPNCGTTIPGVWIK